MPADMRTMPVDNTLQAEIEGPDGELLATQPGAVDMDQSDMDMDMNMDENDKMAVAEAAMPRGPMNYQPSLAGENVNSNLTPADMRSTSVPTTPQAKDEDPDNELLATLPGEVAFSENRRFTVR